MTTPETASGGLIDATVDGDDSVAFDKVFRAELKDIRKRHNRPGRPRIEDTHHAPTTAIGLTGLACSGGGIRSASFCLGVLQGLEAHNVIGKMDYLSTVSGGGYIGTTLTIGMSCGAPTGDGDGLFPFGRLDDERRETPEVRHLRDNSRYLLQNGVPSAISALVIYLRGIAMNVLVLIPILFLAAAVLVLINSDTYELTRAKFLFIDLTGWFGGSRVPFTIVVALAIAMLLVVYAVLVSLFHIWPLRRRQLVAKIAASILAVCALIVVVELHALLLRLVFEARHAIEYAEADQAAVSKGAAVFGFMYETIKKFALLVAPLVVAIMPFLKRLAAKAIEGDGDSRWGDFAKRVGSRLILLVVAAIVPLLLWLAMMELAFWGTAISICPGGHPNVLDCLPTQMTDGWPHAPAWLQGLFGHAAAPLVYAIIMVAALAFWPFLSVNANSLHQLYRDRLGSAFLIRRPLGGDRDDVVLADEFKLTDIQPTQAPYHLINTALNLPGSPFANRRGRNADFFLFSKRYIGSEATGYVRTARAERAVDGLNIGTAMAISGAAAAPNMGMASVRPLSPTIAFLNVRLGRWIRHPRDIASRMTRWDAKHSKKTADHKTERGEPGEMPHLGRIPGPRYLLREAFSKSGATVRARDVEHRDSGFVFLTDGGHIDNLGIYELLRRRCRMIIAIDAEADADLDAASLVQVERFARIDLNVAIKMNWKPIAVRTRAVDLEMRKNRLRVKSGPHVAVGSIDYPPSSTNGSVREKGILIYIKASVSGDENDYVTSYKRRYPAFPHESTMDQLFSEEQFEAYRALGEHIASRFVTGQDLASAFPEDRVELLAMLHEVLPDATLA